MARTEAHAPNMFGRLPAFSSVRRSDRRRSRHAARRMIVAGMWDRLATLEHARSVSFKCCDDDRTQSRHGDIRLK